MIDTVRFLFPNLDRRADRWEWCKAESLNAGVPESQIERVSAYDGLDYLPKSGDPYDVSRLKERIYNDFGKPLPGFLEKSTGVDYVLSQNPQIFSQTPITAYAWSCTWYKCLAKIAEYAHNVAGALLIDDNALSVSYDSFLRMVSVADVSCRRGWGRLLAMQLGCHPAGPDSEANRRGNVVRGASALQRGFAAPDDMGVLYTAAGARFIMSHVDRLAEHNIFVDPHVAVVSIRRSNAVGGFFAPSMDRDFIKGAPPELCYVDPPVYSAEGIQLTDREVGRYGEVWKGELERTGKT